LFVDEVHRFNKGQQDAFLPFVEQGLFTFIGATTENPSFEVNSALLSRAAVYVLKSLNEDELGQLLERALGGHRLWQPDRPDLRNAAPVRPSNRRARQLRPDGDKTRHTGR